MDRIIEKFIAGTRVFLAYGLAFLSIIVFLNTIGRYMFGSILWTMEISRFIYVYLIFIGAFLGFHENSHFVVDFIIKNFSKKVQNIVKIISDLIILSVLFLLLIGSVELLKINTKTITTILKIPYSFLYLPGVIFCVLTIIILLYDLYKTILSIRKISMES